MTKTQTQTVATVTEHLNTATGQAWYGAECEEHGPLMGGDWHERGVAEQAALEHDKEHPLVVQLDGYDDHDGSYSSEVFSLIVNGAPYRMEVWHTDSADGTEFYDDDGGHSGLPDVPEAHEDVLSERIDALTEAFSEAFTPLWEERVAPILREITEQAIASANAAVETQTQA